MVHLLICSLTFSLFIFLVAHAVQMDIVVTFDSYDRYCALIIRFESKVTCSLFYNSRHCPFYFSGVEWLNVLPSTELCEMIFFNDLNTHGKKIRKHVHPGGWLGGDQLCVMHPCGMPGMTVCCWGVCFVAESTSSPLICWSLRQ